MYKKFFADKVINKIDNFDKNPIKYCQDFLSRSIYYRPSPLEVLRLYNKIGSKKELYSLMVKAANKLNNPFFLDGNYRNILIAKELANILPFLNKIVSNILTAYPNYKYLIFGRDAELVYDGLMLQATRINKNSDVFLFPGSQAFSPNFIDTIETLKIRKPTTAQTRLARQLQAKDTADKHRFLAKFGITKQTINKKDHFLLLDTGYLGTLEMTLHKCIAATFENLHNLISAKKLKNYQKDYDYDYYNNNFSDQFKSYFLEYFPAKLIARNSGGYASELISFGKVKNDPELKKKFPKTSSYSKDQSLNWHIATSLQGMPRYHLPYWGLDIDYNPLPAFSQKALRQHFNPTGEANEYLININSSVFNPLAAFHFQLETVTYFAKIKPPKR